MKILNEPGLDKASKQALIKSIMREGDALRMINPKYYNKIKVLDSLLNP